jgi:hypothetical protein
MSDGFPPAKPSNKTNKETRVVLCIPTKSQPQLTKSGCDCATNSSFLEAFFPLALHLNTQIPSEYYPMDFLSFSVLCKILNKCIDRL